MKKLKAVGFMLKLKDSFLGHTFAGDEEGAWRRGEIEHGTPRDIMQSADGVTVAPVYITELEKIQVETYKRMVAKEKIVAQGIVPQKTPHKQEEVIASTNEKAV